MQNKFDIILINPTCYFNLIKNKVTNSYSKLTHSNNNLIKYYNTKVTKIKK